MANTIPINHDDLEAACKEWLENPEKVKAGIGIPIHPYVIQALLKDSKDAAHMRNLLSFLGIGASE